MATTVGSINERGYLKGFKRRGYTNAKCLLELVANSLDSIDRRGSGAGLIRFDMGISEIRMSDNGCGMDRVGLGQMFDLHRENHASDASRGVSGIGAKPALSNLSGDRDMVLLTHREGGEWLRVDIPWSAIHAEGRYTGMVRVGLMSPEEVATFGSGPGTTLVFPYSDMLGDLLYDNFVLETADNELTMPLNRVGIVFGREQVRIEYKHHEDGDIRPMPMYDYLNGHTTAFYTGLVSATIEHWYSAAEGRDRFIWNGKEIAKVGRGFAKEPAPITTNLHGFSRVGDFTVVAGLRRDVAIFDDENPVMPTADKKHRNAYNTEHLGPENNEFLALSKLVRNGQTIGLIPLADKNIANARGNGFSFLSMQLVQCEVRFNPVSTQDNRQDNIMGIQENKNQFDGESLPLNFTRLVKAIRMQKADDIWTYFEITAAAELPEDEDDEDAEDATPTPTPTPIPEPPGPTPTPTPTPDPPGPVPIPDPEPTQERIGLTIIRRIASLLNRLDGSRGYPAAALEALDALENAVA
jgi:hypothetical protein